MLAVACSRENKSFGDEFSGFHPLVNFAYFAFVLGFSMILAHPVSQIISLVCAVCCGISVCGSKGIAFNLKYSLPLLILTAIANPLFNHEGGTILTYLTTGNPLTLESILYGIFSGVMLAAILSWFVSFNKIITSDKLIYLFGRIIPSLSLLLSMTLRFIPRFKKQFDTVKEAQKCMGRDAFKGNIFRRMRSAIAVLSVVITWSLENAVETADSMKSRGYGLKGRSSFSIFRFGSRDKAALAWIIFCGIYVACGVFAGAFEWRFFPRVYGGAVTPLSVSFYAVYLMLCLTPVIINGKELHRWKSLQSRI